MPFAKKTAAFALSTALLLSIVPPAMAADLNLATPTASSSPVGFAASIAKPVDVSGDPSDAKITKENAIELAKKAISLPDGYTLQGISFNSSYMSTSGAWSVQFEKRKDNQYIGNINATIDADSGKLLSYNSYENDPDRIPSYPPKVDLKAAKELAQTLVQSMHPDLTGSLVYNTTFEDNFKPPLNGQIRYSIRYDRTVNGIPFPQNFVEVTFDGEGRWTGYEFQMNTEATFEDTTGTLTAEEAFKQYRAESRPTLLYVATRPNRNENTLKPVLSYTLPFNLLDAKTGKMMDYNGNPVNESSAPAPLTDKPLANKPSSNQNLNKEQAIAAVNSMLPLPAGAVLQNASYNENVDSKFASGASSWNLSWQVPAEKDKDSVYISATVNSKTGEILNYYRNQAYYDKDPAATDKAAVIDTTDKAKEAAISFIKKVLPHYSSELTLNTQNLRPIPMEDLKYMRTYEVNFKRLVNSVESEFESVSVGINLTTGAVENYWNNLSTVAYPNAEGKQIDADRAEELILSEYTLEKRYVLLSASPGYGKPKPIPYASSEPVAVDDSTVKPAAESAKIVYVATPKHSSEYVFLDALTGEWRNRDTGEITVLGKTVVTDLESHWAQKELQLMIDYKAIDAKDGLANPDVAIKRGELIKMLIIAMNGGSFTASYSADRKASFADVANGSTYFSYVESAVDANLIDRNSQTFNPESTMSREEMAELLVRALGYGKLASTQDLFNLNVNDAASVQYKGHVAIVVSLGIMSATDGSFLPTVEVTRAQSATAFYRYLEKRSTLKDSPIRSY